MEEFCFICQINLQSKKELILHSIHDIRHERVKNEIRSTINNNQKFEHYLCWSCNLYTAESPNVHLDSCNHKSWALKRLPFPCEFCVCRLETSEQLNIHRVHFHSEHLDNGLLSMAYPPVLSQAGLREASGSLSASACDPNLSLLNKLPGYEFIKVVKAVKCDICKTLVTPELMPVAEHLNSSEHLTRLEQFRCLISPLSSTPSSAVPPEPYGRASVDIASNPADPIHSESSFSVVQDPADEITVCERDNVLPDVQQGAPVNDACSNDNNIPEHVSCDGLFETFNKEQQGDKASRSLLINVLHSSADFSSLSGVSPGPVDHLEINRSISECSEFEKDSIFGNLVSTSTSIAEASDIGRDGSSCSQNTDVGWVQVSEPIENEQIYANTSCAAGLKESNLLDSLGSRLCAGASCSHEECAIDEDLLIENPQLLVQQRIQACESMFRPGTSMSVSTVATELDFNDEENEFDGASEKEACADSPPPTHCVLTEDDECTVIERSPKRFKFNVERPVERCERRRPFRSPKGDRPRRQRRTVSDKPLRPWGISEPRREVVQSDEFHNLPSLPTSGGGGGFRHLTSTVSRSSSIVDGPGTSPLKSSFLRSSEPFPAPENSLAGQFRPMISATSSESFSVPQNSLTGHFRRPDPITSVLVMRRQTLDRLIHNRPLLPNPRFASALPSAVMSNFAPRSATAITPVPSMLFAQPSPSMPTAAVLHRGSLPMSAQPPYHTLSQVPNRWNAPTSQHVTVLRPPKQC